jgi:ketosteroid isomerase-like protein
MTAGSIVRRYHDAWTSGRYDEAIALLAPSLAVEVPINVYPTAAAFGEALRMFGGMVRAVHLLCALDGEGEAMRLYDLEVAGLAEPLRIAEHFTVEDGRIVRLRQIHDTAALRAAGF